MSTDLYPKHPFDQRDNESIQSFEAFVLYRNMGVARSTRKVAQELGKSIALIQRWSLTHNWTERARSYDAHLDRQLQAQNEQEHFNKLQAYRERAERAAAIASETSILLMQKAKERLEALDASQIDPGDVASLVRAAAQSLTLSLTAEAEAIGVNGLEIALKEKLENESPDAA